MKSFIGTLLPPVTRLPMYISILTTRLPGPMSTLTQTLPLAANSCFISLIDNMYLIKGLSTEDIFVFPIVEIFFILLLCIPDQILEKHYHIIMFNACGRLCCNLVWLCRTQIHDKTMRFLINVCSHVHMHTWVQFLQANIILNPAPH